MTKVVNTISSYRSLLQEQDYQVKRIGVQQLLNHVSTHWTDIANDITLIEDLLQDDKFPDHQLVAFLLSKLYFYLNDYNQAVKNALVAGSYFEISTNDQFTVILVNKCIEKYVLACSGEGQKHIYQPIVDKMIENSIKKGDLKLVLGIALQTSDLQLFTTISKEMNFHDLVQSILPHLFALPIAFKAQILAQITTHINQSIVFTPLQHINILQLLYIKGDYEVVARIVYECVKKGDKQIAYTLALQVSEMHGFNKKVLSSIPIETEFEEERKNIEYIIEGKFTDDIHNIVLKNMTKTDPYYLSVLKKIQAKNSIAHGSALMSLSMLQAFTQDDSFLQIKQNLEWASKSTHWNKFTSIASLGLIFRNHKDKNVFKKMLPEATGDLASQYSNGGSLYGLGLLFTGTLNQQIVDYIISITTNPTHNQNQVVMHGACLGLGLTAFASGNQPIGDRLKDILNSGTSVMGEASALGLGLIYAGTNNQSILSQLIAIAQDTQHQKTLRSICIAIGLISFQSPSQQFLKNLQDNQTVKSAIPHYFSCAYFKTSDSMVVKKLLKLSNDISNQVKRSSIIALGFVMYHDEKLYDLIKMLLYSYNPYIRFGCVIALAIGSKQPKDAIDLIWPLLTDSVDFVRQGVYIALSILFQTATNQSEPKLADFRKTIQQILLKTHGQIMAKMGAIISIGLSDIGGRNMIVSLTTRSGLPKIEAITGMLIFTQYWNWFPYLNFIGLAITPSTFIGVTANLKIPKSFQIKSNCKPSLFQYPANIVIQEKKNDNKKDKAKELSTTTKVKNREALKKKDSDINQTQVLVKKPSLISSLPKEHEPEKMKEKEKPKEEKKEEELFSVLNNPTRISQKQKKYVEFLQSRYVPILPNRKIGISFLRDSQPQEKDDYLQLVTKAPQKMDLEKPLDKIIEHPKDDQSPVKPENDQMQPEGQFQYDEQQQLLKKKQ